MVFLLLAEACSFALSGVIRVSLLYIIASTLCIEVETSEGTAGQDKIERRRDIGIRTAKQGS